MKDEYDRLVNNKNVAAEIKEESYSLQQAIVKSSPFGAFFLMVKHRKKLHEMMGCDVHDDEHGINELQHSLE